jgi:ribosomal protein S18 acetylase RimI-like enzyme
MTIRIRTYEPSDHEFILSLVSRFSGFELPEWRQRDEIDNRNRTTLEKMLKQPKPDSAIFIADDENAGPAGFVHLETENDYFREEKYGYISDLAVDISYEGQGIGRMLLKAAEDWAGEKGYRLLALHVFAGNTHAQHLYEKNGFKPEVIKYVKTM